MNKSQKDKTQAEIDYWKMHLDSIDKTNIEDTTSKAIMKFELFIGIMVSFFIGILSIDSEDIPFEYRLIGALVVVIISAFRINKFISDANKEILSHDLSFRVRERMIRQRYESLYGLSKDELNKEFEDVKKIYQASESELKQIARENAITDYYKRKKK